MSLQQESDTKITWSIQTAVPERLHSKQAQNVVRWDTNLSYSRSHNSGLANKKHHISTLQAKRRTMVEIDLIG